MVRCLVDALRFALPLLAAASAEQEPSPDLPTPLRNERAATAGGGVGALGGALAATLGSDSIAAVSSHRAAADATAMAVAAVDATGHATALKDPGAADAAAADSPRHPLLDASGAALSGALNTRCQYAVSNALARDAAAEPPPVHPSDLSSLRVSPRNETHSVRLAYLIGIGARPSALPVVQRLIYALYSPVHAFLLHVDVKAADEVTQGALKLERAHPNVICLRTRRLVQWGMWSMVGIMLDALESLLVHGPQFDFFINLSDADLALRTDAEMRTFFSRMNGRSMINVHDGGGDILMEANRFIETHVIVECGGFGFVVVNKTKHEFPLTAGCCIGRSGPAAFAQLPIAKHPVLDQVAVQTGSQWASLHYDFCHFLMRDPLAKRLRAAFERRLVPDEALLQTVVMNSPFKQSLLNHNLRWIYWPHQVWVWAWLREGGKGR